MKFYLILLTSALALCSTDGQAPSVMKLGWDSEKKQTGSPTVEPLKTIDSLSPTVSPSLDLTTDHTSHPTSAPTDQTSSPSAAPRTPPSQSPSSSPTQQEEEGKSLFAPVQMAVAAGPYAPFFGHGRSNREVFWVDFNENEGQGGKSLLGGRLLMQWRVDFTSRQVALSVENAGARDGWISVGLCPTGRMADARVVVGLDTMVNPSRLAVAEYLLHGRDPELFQTLETSNLLDASFSKELGVRLSFRASKIYDLPILSPLDGDALEVGESAQGHQYPEQDGGGRKSREADSRLSTAGLVAVGSGCAVFVLGAVGSLAWTKRKKMTKDRRMDLYRWDDV